MGHVPDHTTYPAWFYGPEGQSALFDSAEEVPSDWRDNPSAFAQQSDEEPEPGRQPLDAVADNGFYDAMGVEELKAALTGKGIKFHPNASKQKLISLYKTARPEAGHPEN